MFTLDQWRIAYRLLDDRRNFRRLVTNVTPAGPVVSALMINMKAL
jgi:hypothetical protein